MRRAISGLVVLTLFAVVSAAWPSGAWADGPPASNPAPPAATTADDDMEPQPAQPDFTIINLPTNLRLPEHRLAFRVTHRFTRSLNQDSFRSSLSDAFGLDSGARIGLELRFAPFGGAEVGVYRTNDKTIDFFGEYSVVQQNERVPVSVSAVGGVEGTSNFTDLYSPSIGAVVGRKFGDRAALYAVPMWINNTNPLPPAGSSSESTFLLGLGARVQLVKSVYVVAEVSPRLSGFKGGINQEGTTAYQPGKTAAAFAIEKQVGGHVFQINFSNSFATTPANIARGAAPGKTNWYLGFNISRKFY